MLAERQRANSPLQIIPTTDERSGVALTLDAQAYEGLKSSSQVRIEQFAMPDGSRVALDLERFEIYAPNATIVMVDEAGEHNMPRPDVVLLRGGVSGKPGSRVFLGLSPLGTNGYVQMDGKMLIIAEPKDKSAPIRIYDPADLRKGEIKLRPFTCGNENLPNHGALGRNPIPAGPAASGGARTGGIRTVRLAVETDFEYTSVVFGGNATNSAAYIAVLIAADSEIYRSEVQTQFQITFSRVWAANVDPYPDASTIDTRLDELRNNWNANMRYVDRNIAHMLSGRSSGAGGIAFLGSLCDDFSSGYGYGVSGWLDGYFPYPLVSNNPSNWDAVVTAHEIGHNFDAPHTHQMSPPIDCCGGNASDGDNCGFVQDCSNASQGTIMSYCQTCAPGVSNIAFSVHQRIRDERMLPYLAGLDCISTRERIIRKIVAPGDALPGGTFGHLYNTGGWINQEGSVAFDGYLASGPRCLWAGPPGAPSMYVQTGQQAPGAATGVIISNIVTSGLAFNAQGQSAIVSGLSGPGVDGSNGNQYVIYLASPGSLEKIARGGDPVPGSPGQIFTGLGVSLLDDNGVVSFSATQGSPQHQHLWRGTPSGINRITQEDPNITGAWNCCGPYDLTEFSQTPGGKLGFTSPGYTNPQCGQPGPCPGQCGCPFRYFFSCTYPLVSLLESNLIGYSHTRISDNGYAAYHRGDSAGGLFWSGGSAFQPVIQWGQQAMGAPFGTTYNVNGISESISINDSGDVLFYAQLSGTLPGGNSNWGLYCGKPANLRLVLRGGNVLPGMSPGTSVRDVERVHFNNSGLVAFVAYDYPGNGNALYLSYPSGQFVQLARSGQVIETSLGVTQTISQVDMSAGPFGHGPNDGGATTMNDTGQLVFTLYTSNYAVASVYLTEEVVQLPGDLNCDRAVSLADVPIFVNAVLQGTGIFGCSVSRADMNGDGSIDGRDIAPFIAVLVGP